MKKSRENVKICLHSIWRIFLTSIFKNFLGQSSIWRILAWKLCHSWDIFVDFSTLCCFYSSYLKRCSRGRRCFRQSCQKVKRIWNDQKSFVFIISLISTKQHLSVIFDTALSRDFTRLSTNLNYFLQLRVLGLWFSRKYGKIRVKFKILNLWLLKNAFDRCVHKYESFLMWPCDIPFISDS